MKAAGGSLRGIMATVWGASEVTESQDGLGWVGPLKI